MHKESIQYMRETFARHTADMTPGVVLDVGATGKRPWYRGIWEEGGWRYEGCDLAEGPNVDHVLEDPWIYPMEDDSFDAVISGQMLEHNEFFWLSFLEMARVLKPGGLMIHIVPSRGHEHRAPQDCWRFYRDGMEALARWSGLTLVEATTDWTTEHFDYWRQKRRSRVPELRQSMRQADTPWGDTVGVFRKEASLTSGDAARYIRHFKRTFDRLKRAEQAALAAE